MDEMGNRPEIPLYRKMVLSVHYRHLAPAKVLHFVCIGVVLGCDPEEEEDEDGRGNMAFGGRVKIDSREILFYGSPLPASSPPPPPLALLFAASERILFHPFQRTHHKNQ